MTNLFGKRHVLNLCYLLAGDIFFQKNPPPGSVGSNLKHSGYLQKKWEKFRSSLSIIHCVERSDSAKKPSQANVPLSWICSTMAFIFFSNSPIYLIFYHCIDCYSLHLETSKIIVLEKTFFQNASNQHNVNLIQRWITPLKVAYGIEVEWWMRYFLELSQRRTSFPL